MLLAFCTELTEIWNLRFEHNKRVIKFVVKCIITQLGFFSFHFYKNISSTSNSYVKVIITLLSEQC